MGWLSKSAAFLISCALVIMAWQGAPGDFTPPAVALRPVSADALADARTLFGEISAEESKWVCVEIGASSFAIRYGARDAELTNCDESPLAYILCDRANANSGVGENSTLACMNCRLVMPDGTAAEATEALFDAESGKLTLRGTAEAPVKVTLTNGASIAAMSAAELTLEVHPSVKEAPAPATPAATPPRAATPLASSLISLPEQQ